MSGNARALRSTTHHGNRQTRPQRHRALRQPQYRRRHSGSSFGSLRTNGDRRLVLTHEELGKFDRKRAVGYLRGKLLKRRKYTARSSLEVASTTRSSETKTARLR